MLKSFARFVRYSRILCGSPCYSILNVLRGSNILMRQNKLFIPAPAKVYARTYIFSVCCIHYISLYMQSIHKELTMPIWIDFIHWERERSREKICDTIQQILPKFKDFTFNGKTDFTWLWINGSIHSVHTIIILSSFRFVEKNFYCIFVWSHCAYGNGRNSF